MSAQDKMVQRILEWLGTGTILILGRPYSGKSFQSKKLAELFSLPILDSGELLRAMQADLSPEVAAIQNSGALIPSDALLEFLTPHIASLPAEQGAIFCSVGKMSGEEGPVMQAAAQSGHPIKIVIYVAVSRDIALARWAKEQADASSTREARADDARENQGRRHDWFRDQTMPVVSSYRQLGLVMSVDGEQPREAVTSAILTKLADIAGE